jgi:PAS domain S-box-containing protein
LLPALIGKCLLVLFCALLPVLALINMRRRQRAAGRPPALSGNLRRHRRGPVRARPVQPARPARPLPPAQPRRAQAQPGPGPEPAPLAAAAELKITEVNQVARQLLNVDCNEGAWQRLIDGSGDGRDSVGMQLIDALIERSQLELEVRLPAAGRRAAPVADGRLPQQRRDYQAVILSISDITSRKQVELSLLERESFWSDVVRTVPDQLYVQDVISQRMIFSNRHLGQTLGYDRAELAQMGERFWELLLHPEDAEHYQALRQQQLDSNREQSLHCQLRFRHRDGSWRCYDIREQVLTRDSDGLVTRIIGVGKDVTVQIEASESLRDSEQRYRMLAESISDVIFSTDSLLQLNYVSPSVQAVLGYEADWIFANGWQSIIANPAQLTGIYGLMERVSKASATASNWPCCAPPTQLFLFDCLRADGRKIPSSCAWCWCGTNMSASRRARRRPRHQPAAPRRERPAHGGDGIRALHLGDPDHRPGRLYRPGQRGVQPVSGYAVAEVLDQLPGMLTVDTSRKPTCATCSSNCTSAAAGKAKCGSSAATASLPGLGRHHRGTRRRRRPGQLRVLLHRHQRAQGQRTAHPPPGLLRRPDPPAQPHAVPGPPAHRPAAGRTAKGLGGADVPRPRPLQADQRLPRPRRRRSHAQGHGQRLLACVDDDDTVARMGGDEFTLLLQPATAKWR